MSDSIDDNSTPSTPEEGSTLQSLIAAAIGVFLSVVGAWAAFAYGRVLLQRPDGADGLNVGIASLSYFVDVTYHSSGLILLILWFATGLLLLITGLSLLISGIRRKAYDLVPGPTLYLLGLCIVGIGICLGIGGSWPPAIAAVLLGLAICYWEWAYEIS